ncbi:MAG: ChbG/HpnK family deacetylase [Bacteroidales bacterium]|nr:ChbG/HpnK family deacetylase [Bacteroidales bacterium]
MKIRIILLLLILVLPNLFLQAQQPIKLIVRADDMGYHNDINNAIIKAQGWYCNLCKHYACFSVFVEGVKLCKENPKLAAGVHIAVMGTGFRPVLSPEEIPTLVDARGYFF